MGNAIGALGGDMTAVCINPGGLGLYRSNELTFSTGLQYSPVSSSMFGNHEWADKFNVSIPNVGYVHTLEWSNYKPLRFIQLAIGLTRTNDFNYHSVAQGTNPNSSMVDAWLQTIEGIDDLYDPTLSDPGPYLEDNYPYDLFPAWQTFLIDRFQDSLGYYYSSPIPKGNVNQKNEVNSTGRSEEWTFSIGTNFYDKLFFGGSLGVAHLKRAYNRTFTETPKDAGDTDYTFSEWSYQDELKLSGWGVNFKCGIVYFPTSWLRIGAAWHSRTSYALEENWSTTTESKLIENHTESYHKHLSPTAYNDYDFKTPHTFIGSMAFFIGHHGLLTTDVEYQNYRQSSFHSSTINYTDTNNDIQEVLGSTVNIRLGTEWRVRQFFLRGGLAYYGSPYGFGKDFGSVKKLGLGFGYAAIGGFNWDFAYELTETSTEFSPYYYYVNGENIAGNIVQHSLRNKFIITLKIKI